MFSLDKACVLAENMTTELFARTHSLTEVHVKLSAFQSERDLLGSGDAAESRNEDGH